MTTALIGRDEAAEYYFTYINQVRLEPGQDIVDQLGRQAGALRALCGGITEDGARHRYAPGKWSVKQTLSHINDTERVFAFRAFWFSRGLAEALPSFDQDVAVASSHADDRTWTSHVEEFAAVRAATQALFASLSVEAWTRRGVASGNPFSVRALAHITVGHVAHHVEILRERYRVG